MGNSKKCTMCGTITADFEEKEWHTCRAWCVKCSGEWEDFQKQYPNCSEDELFKMGSTPHIPVK